MTIKTAVTVGLAGNELSKKIVGTSEVSAGRTVVATGSGAALGAVSVGTIVIGAGIVGVATTPVTIPLCVGGAIIGGIASLFD